LLQLICPRLVFVRLGLRFIFFFQVLHFPLQLLNLLAQGSNVVGTRADCWRRIRHSILRPSLKSICPEYSDRQSKSQNSRDWILELFWCLCVWSLELCPCPHSLPFEFHRSLSVPS